MSNAEENQRHLELVLKAQKGDDQAAATLLELTEPWIDGWAWKYWQSRGKDSLREELQQAALIRIWQKAIPRFDANKGRVWRAYAKRVANDGMRNLIAETDFTSRLPKGTFKELGRLKRTRERMASRGEPSSRNDIEALARESGLTTTAVKRLLIAEAALVPANPEEAQGGLPALGLESYLDARIDHTRAVAAADRALAQALPDPGGKPVANTEALAALRFLRRRNGFAARVPFRVLAQDDIPIGQDVAKYWPRHKVFFDRRLLAALESLCTLDLPPLQHATPSPVIGLAAPHDSAFRFRNTLLRGSSPSRTERKRAASTA